MISRILKKIPAPLRGEKTVRMEPCRICGELSGLLIAKPDYWNIRKSDLVKCDKCGLTQLDPMLTQDDTSQGCLAYYIEESLRVSCEEFERNLVRNFRRGIVFAYSLKKKKINPKQILELGPGSGFFSAGIRFIFPDTIITVMDINKDVLNFNQEHFICETIQSIPDEYIKDLEGKFDLIIARDILEHVTDISKVIRNINAYLKPSGLFHFITPNGHEDLWKHYLTYNQLNAHSELLINHVNYFDGEGLRIFLEQNNLEPINFYTYKIKTTLRGRGWQVKKKLMAPRSQNKDAGYFIREKINEVRELQISSNKVLNKWYISEKNKFLVYWIGLYHHSSLIKLPPELNVGHEIYGLFRKTISVKTDGLQT